MSSRGLPSGTVTFLFTDVEGSTRLLSELGAEAYAEALAEHRRVIREACAREGGVEVDTQGDAFFFAFPTAPGALAAAAGLTEGLASGPIRVRVGVHTGTPLLGEEGYVGHDVHRAARIAASGHGGQVLVSASTAPLVEVELRDLGEHRFKDLSAPERVYQLGAGDFPALKTLYRTNLPVPATPFLGRENELREVAGLLERPDTRLVTLTGPGGTGKTRLALQAAAGAAEGFPDGVFWIPLAPLRDASLLETTFAQALEVSEQPGVAAADSIVGAFAGKRALLVVDNCEHLVDAVADLLRRLVEGCPTLVLAASSRERLGLRAEHVYAVPPMAVSDGERLFIERALAVSPDFEPDEHVATICERVDGLPLAIELAAARVRSLSMLAILERLSERLPLLATRDRDIDERQRTLEATIAWSYDLLDPEEQRVLRALSAFAGGCTLEAAEAVADADLDVLESLLDKSLLRHRIDEAGQDRYWLLETIREFAATRLEDEGESGEATRRHRLWYLEFARGAEPHFRSTDVHEWYVRVDQELANLRVALEHASNREFLVELPGLLWKYLMEREDFIEGQRWLEAALAASDDAPTATRERLLAGAGWIACARGEYELAVQRAQERLEVAKKLRDPLAEARSLSMLGSILADTGDFQRAIDSCERAVTLTRESVEASTFYPLAVHNLGVTWERAGDAARARAAFQEEVRWAAKERDLGGVAKAHFSLAGAAMVQGDYEDARRHIDTALALWLEHRVDYGGVIRALVDLATINSQTRRPHLAAKLLAVVEKRCEETGEVLEPQRQRRFADVEASLLSTVPERELAMLWREGRSLSLELAVKLALSSEPSGVTDMSLQDNPPM